MLDPLFNGFLLFMAVIWIMGLTRKLWLVRFTSSLKSHRILVPAIVWAVFLAFAASYVLWFDQIADVHDIPQAVSGAVTGLDQGENPYVDHIVPRFESGYNPRPSVDLGTYNYLPFDLLVYSGAHSLLGVFGFPMWFAIANVIFCFAALALFRVLVPIKLRVYIPAAGLVILFYSFDNGSLTMLLVAASILALARIRWHPEIISVIIMGLAAMTKVYAVIPFAVLVLWLLHKHLGSRDVLQTAKVAGAVGASAMIGVVLMLPFGVMHVLDSAVFFHASASTRVGTSSGGTLLMQVGLGSQGFVLVAIASLVAAVVVSLAFRSLNDRMILGSLVMLLVAAKSSMSMATVTGLFLVLEAWRLSRPAFQVDTASVDRIKNTRRYWALRDRPLSSRPLSWWDRL